MLIQGGSLSSQPSAPPVHKEKWNLKAVEGGKVRDQFDNVWTPAQKAYRNVGFLSNRHARNLRILSEHMETELRLAQENVHHTILVFCSARGRSRAQWEQQLAEAKETASRAKTKADIERASSNRLRVERLEWMCAYYDKTRELTRKLAEWNRAQPLDFVVASGGGPGLMEAANEGAILGGGRTVGMGISVPFEPGLNKFVSNELAFEFHYFFTRKFWMSYPARALIVSPGGFGTIDELFEILTLQQCKKMYKTPIICFGVKYWKSVINIHAMVEYGTVSPEDAKRIYFTDSVDDAFEHVTAGLEQFQQQFLNSEIKKLHHPTEVLSPDVMRTLCGIKDVSTGLSSDTSEDNQDLDNLDLETPDGVGNFNYPDPHSIGKPPILDHTKLMKEPENLGYPEGIPVWE